MGTGEGVRVLLVDDNADVATVTQMHLHRRDEAFAVTVAESAAEALDALEDSVDCIVSDYEMPRVDGLELLREVRERDPALPFILFTGRGSEEIASEAISAGVTDYLQKETGTDQYAVLANRIRNAVDHRRSVAAAAETESRYRRLVESSPHAIFVHDGERNLFVNDRYAELVGADDAEEVVGTDPLGFVHPENRDAIADRIDNVLEEKRRNPWFESRLVTLDDEIRHIESCATPVVYEGQDASQVVVRDVTDQYRRERRLEALHDATRRLLTATDRQTVGELTVEALANVFDEPVTAVWEYDADTHALAPLVASENAAAVARDAGFEPGVSPLPEWTVEMAAYEAGEQRVVDDYADREDSVADALESVFLQPLDEFGLLTIGSYTPRSFDHADRDLIGVLARSVVATFERLEDGSA